VRKISSNTGGVDNIVEGQLVNIRAQLEEEGERLFAPGQFSCSSIFYFSSDPELVLRTWPIPPEAPATTIQHRVSRDSIVKLSRC